MRHWIAIVAAALFVLALALWCIRHAPTAFDYNEDFPDAEDRWRAERKTEDK